MILHRLFLAHGLAPETARRRVGARALLLALAAASIFAVGCTSGPTATGASSDLLATDPPLEQVDLGDVATASSSCEGLLSRVTDFALLGETGLVVGLDAGGGAVCIDTVEAVNTELGDCGRWTDAGELVARYQVTMAMRESRGARIRRFQMEGDPNPEPNSPIYFGGDQGRPPGI
jgi:hypothetical protein